MKTKPTKRMGTLFKTLEVLNCNEGSKNFQLLIDGEASSEQEHKLLNHLNECELCSSTFTLDKTLKKIIKAKIQDKPCPPHLVENIRAKLLHND